MTWREQLIARILLLIARMVAEDPAVADALRHLGNHIAATAPKRAEATSE